MRILLSVLLLASTFGCAIQVTAAEAQVLEQVTIFSRDGMFAGWPANHGLWSWGNELLVGLSTGFHKDLGERHNIDRDRPEHHILARSRDGGQTWTLEFPASKGMLINQGGMRHGTTDPKHTEPEPAAIREPIDFAHPDFCMTLRFEHVHGGTSRLYYSYDRGHHWTGPFKVPPFEQPGIMARTDYLVNSSSDCHVFLTASKKNRKEGRVICGRTSDSGRTWHFQSYVGPEPSGFAIMPSTVRVDATRLIMATRRREGPDEPKRRWIDIWASDDNGLNWRFVSDAVSNLGEGNPPSLIRLEDGRLCLTYGVRMAPFEIQARLSSDQGKSWSEPIVLRTGGGGRDLGYPRTVQRPDGKIVTIYYFQSHDSPYREVLATIWDCGTP